MADRAAGQGRCVVIAALILTAGCSSPSLQLPGTGRQVPLPVVADDKHARVDLGMLRAGLAAAPVREAGDLPSVVMVVLDTFRADRLQAYGADQVYAPRLDQFMSSAQVFTNMRSSGAWTLPSHASLFTGYPAITHGARGASVQESGKALGLTDALPTLAERMQAAGYLTVGVVANQAFLDSSWGLSRGFDVWLCEDLLSGVTGSYPQGDRITALATAAFREADRPIFLFVNYMDTHTPWHPREGYVRQPEALDAWVLPKAKAWKRRGGWVDSKRAVLGLQRDPKPNELLTWREAYDAEVRWVDEQAGALLSQLPSLGHDEDDYTMVLSDHGEFLGEHGLVEHSKALYEEVLRVPLAIRGPGFTPGADPTHVTSAQVPDLLLGALGLPRLSPPAWHPEAEGLQVSELYWARRRERKVPEVAARLDHVYRSFTLDGQKLILSETGGDERYDLRRDPREQEPLPINDDVKRLREMSEAWMLSHEQRAGEAPELDDEQRARLEALGYL